MTDITGPPHNERSRAGVGPDTASGDARLAVSRVQTTREVSDQQDRYPWVPGWKVRDTSRLGAEFIAPKAKTLRQHVLGAIEARKGTPEQIHARLAAQGINHLLTAIRPRCSELARMGLIRDSGERGLGESQRCKSIVWIATTPDERSLFAASAAVAAEHGENPHG